MDNGHSLRRHQSESVLRSHTSHTSTSVLIMGLKSVGKTTVLHQLQKYSSKDLGLDERRRKSDMNIDIKVPEQLQFSEATQFPFKSLRKIAIKATRAFVLVYAVNDEVSFDYVTKLLGEIIALKGNDVPLVVLANKIDLSPRQVHPIIADCVVTIDYECKHKEVCAESGEGMKEVLSCLLSFYGDCILDPSEIAYRSGIRQSLRKKFALLFRK